jgi:hypothetical protein
LREELLENRVLRIVCEPKRDEEKGNGENHIIRSFVISTPYTKLCGW